MAALSLFAANRNAMLKNLKEAVRNRDRLVGCFVSIPHPAAVEACATDDVDLVCLDAEHASIGRETMEHMLRAAECRHVPALVRVPGATSGWIGWALDAGAQGVVVPHVETEDDARQAVSAAYYAPRGQRGVGISRGSSYGAQLRTIAEHAHERTCVVVQIETFAGVRNAARIASVPGIDAVFIGPFDLAQSLLALPASERPSLDEAIASIKDACDAVGCSVGIFRPDDSDRHKWSGYPLLIVGTDVTFLQMGIRSSRSAQHA